MADGFRGPIGFVDLETGDYRIIENLTTRQAPMTFSSILDGAGYGHEGRVPTARIDRVWMDGTRLMGEGPFSATEPGRRAAELLREGVLQGVSMDPGPAAPGDLNWVEEWVDPNTGEVVSMDEIDALMEACWDDDAEACDTLYGLRVRTKFLTYMAGGATQVDVPAFADARVDYVANYQAADLTGEALQASAMPAPTVPANLWPGVFVTQTPPDRLGSFLTARRRRTAGATPVYVPRPAAWYRQQDLSGLTRLTVAPDGHVYGHVAPWNACHRSVTSRCVTPEYQTDFPEFNDQGGQTPLDDGTLLPTGALTHLERHADAGPLTITELQRLMEDNGLQWATGRLYADDFGIQFAGSILPDVTPETVNRALSAPPSGDWREIKGRWRLFGVHCVTTAGYPVYDEADGVRRMVASMIPVEAAEHSHGCDGTCATTEPEPAKPDCGCSHGPAKLSAAGLRTLVDLDAVVRPRR